MVPLPTAGNRGEGGGSGILNFVSIQNGTEDLYRNLELLNVRFILDPFLELNFCIFKIIGCSYFTVMFTTLW